MTIMMAVMIFIHEHHASAQRNCNYIFNAWHIIIFNNICEVCTRKVSDVWPHNSLHNTMQSYGDVRWKLTPDWFRLSYNTYQDIFHHTCISTYLSIYLWNLYSATSR